ncbi:Pentatricopeptide repeat-containing protein -mitochondrial [Striga hermonthica]|uniref:Pentatricopeptide repeat-containing protein -mitochondrial n=1 Tax=Striga hermonthica TaxID=68872 RepID=A0A9N7ND56_STRHE|nr:Pentatricopeptide repeat-containing protein -mitochondrial [Striga hermonthica]
MLPRIFRTPVAAARRLSTQAAAVAVSPSNDAQSRYKKRDSKDKGLAAAQTEVAGPGDLTTAAKDDEIAKSGGGGGRDALARRLFSLVYSKRSAAVAIRKWKEEGQVVQKYEQKYEVADVAIRLDFPVCEWMRTQDDMKLVSGDYAVHLDLIAKMRGLNSAEKFFEDLPENMRDHATCSSLLHTYVQHKEPEKAEALMAKMSECGFLKSPLPYNHMLALYLSTGQLEKIPVLIKDLKKNITSPDTVTYNLWLAACGSQNCVETAEKVFREQINAKINPDWVTYSTLASIYIKNSMRDKAESSLKDMERKITKKDRAGFSSLISLHASLENTSEILRLWKLMKSTYRKLNDAEYTCVISSLLKVKDFKEANKFYDEWESISPTSDSRIPNLLIAAYINSDQMEKAKDFFERMVKRETVPGYTTWELLTWGYLKERNLEKVLDSFKKAVKSVRKWDPDEKLVHEVFKIVEDFGNVDCAEELIRILRRAGYVNAEIYKCLLRTYAKAGKMALVMEERLKKDGVEVDEEIKRLVQLTSKMCVGEIPSEV